MKIATMITGEEAIEKLRELGFKCQQCGNCCLESGNELSLDDEETKRWLEFEDLVPSNFGYCFPSDFTDIIPETGCADLWFHPDTGEELTRCPFLRKTGAKYQCLIYSLRPEACKSYPLDPYSGKLRDEGCPEVKRLIIEVEK